MSKWKEVERSVPAEELEHVPDGATVYAAWIDVEDYDKSITIYKAHEETFWLVKEHNERFYLQLAGVSKTRAFDKAHELRQEWHF